MKIFVEAREKRQSPGSEFKELTRQQFAEHYTVVETHMLPEWMSDGRLAVKPVAGYRIEVEVPSRQYSLVSIVSRANEVIVFLEPRQ